MKLALTFDDGPHRSIPTKFLRSLKVRSTRDVFVVGGKCGAIPRCRRGRVIADGHELGKPYIFPREPLEAQLPEGVRGDNVGGKCGLRGKRVPHAPSPSAGRSLQRFDIPYRGQA